jgi:hypothetical protein
MFVADRIVVVALPAGRGSVTVPWKAGVIGEVGTLERSHTEEVWLQLPVAVLFGPSV